jgi:hypothetical protein
MVPLALLDHSQFLGELERWPINSSYPIIYVMCIMYSMSQLKKCLRVPEKQLPMDELSVKGDLNYTEYPIKILDTLTRVTRNKVIKMCKVQWIHHGEDEAT